MRTTELNIDVLTANAYTWRGTPFVPNACERGPHGGVCDYMLVADLYRRAGLEIGEVPYEPPRTVRSGSTPVITLWLEYSPYFLRLPHTAPLRPGDLLGFDIGPNLQHLAIVLPGNKIVQVLNQLGVVIRPWHEGPLASQNASRWRPIPSNHWGSSDAKNNHYDRQLPRIQSPTINRCD